MTVSNDIKFRRHLLRAVDAFESVKNNLRDTKALVALVKDMLFELDRARRILRDDKKVAETLKTDREAFLAATKNASKIRHVVEHSSDVKNPREAKQHEAGGFSIDETSIVIFSAEEIYMGPENIFDVYKYIKSVADAVANIR